jgi:uncharacterized protein (TIGR03032 family)
MANDLSAPPPAAPPAPTDLSSQHSSNFPDLLRQLRASLLVSTYQAGKLVLVRPDGNVINTHYRTFARPMGMALSPKGALALGTNTEIIEFRNVPSVAGRLDPPNRNDAVFMPRRAFITGAIDIHEMAYGSDETLWYVNTLFSCLCTLDRESSFVPVWRPRFVTKYSAEDRCHLNGLALRDGKPATLTALGVSDEVEGWRANKRDGGIAIDYASGEIIASGLCMPHSPRWHDGKLWLLESGRGALLQLDAATGAKTEIARLPGFLRGLDFAGPLAFVGLCQQRETNAFTDIPITDENRERLSGVWVVDTRNGQTVALLKFTGGVQEIFAVTLLFGATYPELINEAGDLLSTVYALPDEFLVDAVPPRPRPGKDAGQKPDSSASKPD